MEGVIGAAYRTATRLAAAKPEAVVIMCSDRRYRPATEEFLAQHLHLTTYETVAVPGGAYVISFADALPKQLKVGMRLLRFIMKSYEPPRIVIVAHEDCGRYVEGFSSLLNRAGFSLEAKQRHDVAAAIRELAATFPGVRVDGFYARPVADGRVEFEPITK